MITTDEMKKYWGGFHGHWLHKHCQHCTHYCDDCGVEYCCKCGKEFGPKCYPFLTTTHYLNRPMDAACHHSHN